MKSNNPTESVGMPDNTRGQLIINPVVWIMAGAIIVAVCLTIAALISSVIIDKASKQLAIEIQNSNQTFIEQLKENNQKQIDTIKDIGIKTPPTNDQLFTIMSKGLGVSENVIATSEVGVTPAAAFATDLTSSQQTNATTQEVIFQNRDDTTNLCFKPISWSAGGGATCALKCAAATITCPAANGAGTTASDGTVTPPGGAWPRRYDGTSCLCIVGSAANTAYQTERVIR
jgi:uncharacterized protein (UPF0333 family)